MIKKSLSTYPSTSKHVFKSICNSKMVRCIEIVVFTNYVVFIYIQLLGVSTRRKRAEDHYSNSLGCAALIGSIAIVLTTYQIS